MTERTTTCCLGDVFFRKRRYSSEVYAPSLKPKIPPSDYEDQSKVALEGISRLHVHTEAIKVSSIERTLQQTNSPTSNSRQLTAADYYANRKIYSFPPTPESGLTSGSTTRPAQPPSLNLGTIPIDEPPPKYSPPPTNYSTGQRSQARLTSRGLGLEDRDIAKDQDLVQALWIENQRRSPAVLQIESCRTPVNAGSSSGLRTITIVDKTTNTTYRRGRLLGKVRNLLCMIY